MGGMLGDSPHRKWQRGCGNGCCSPKAEDRTAKKAVKQHERRELETLVAEETALDPEGLAPDEDDAHYDCRFDQSHVVIGGNCIFCGTDDHDIGGSGFPVGETCTSRNGDPFTYFTETPR